LNILIQKVNLVVQQYAYKSIWEDKLIPKRDPSSNQPTSTNL